jgi:hypothetical protein
LHDQKFVEFPYSIFDHLPYNPLQLSFVGHFVPQQKYQLFIIELAFASLPFGGAKPLTSSGITIA